MRVSIVYREDCPNIDAVEEHVREALAALDKSDTPIQRVSVTTEQEAQRASMHGSPTVLIDGEDPFAPADAPTKLACRPEGAPTVEDLIDVMS